MATIDGPIYDLAEAFVAFRRQEENYGVKYMVKPSGSLTSQVAHYLNQPSFSTDEERWEDGKTADLHNPYTKMVMENAFRLEHTMILDHIHC